MLSFKDVMIQRTLLCLWLLGALTCLLWLLVGSVAYWVRHGWLPDDSSGWVQALGALLAVAVAIAVPAWQKRHEMQLAALADRKLRIDSVNAVLSLTQDLVLYFGAAANSLTTARRREMLESLARVCRNYADLELTSFGNEMVTFVLTLKSAALYGEQFDADRLQGPDLKWEVISKELQRRLNSLTSQERHLLGYFDSLERY